MEEEKTIWSKTDGAVIMRGQGYRALNLGSCKMTPLLTLGTNWDYMVAVPNTCWPPGVKDFYAACVGLAVI